MKTAKIHHGSVVVFDANGVDPQVSVKTDYVKRVIGLPGDTVSSKNGNIYVNGKKINQDYISKSQRTTGTGNWTLRSISVQNSWLRIMVPQKFRKVNTLFLGITGAFQTMVVTGDLYLRVKSMGL